jgi:hypothetical protein
MNVEVVGRVVPTLPADDDRPYRTGAWQPNFVEYDATDPSASRAARTPAGRRSLPERGHPELEHMTTSRSRGIHQLR